MENDKRRAVVNEAGAWQIEEFKRLYAGLSDEQRREFSIMVRKWKMRCELRGGPPLSDERKN